METSRRKFLKTGVVSLTGLTLACKNVGSGRSSPIIGSLPVQPERIAPTVYFVDGWHGGVFGHMPIRYFHLP